MENKPGYKSTEFWLSLAATLVGGLLASGLIPTDGVWGTVTGLVVGLFSALGYTVSRSWTKVSVAKAEAIKEASKVPLPPS